MSDAPHTLLDTTGLKCPEPVMLLHKMIRQMQVGESVKLIATDPSTERDIPRFCEFLHHSLTESSVAEGRYIYVIRKGQKPAS